MKPTPIQRFGKIVRIGILLLLLIAAVDVCVLPETGFMERPRMKPPPYRLQVARQVETMLFERAMENGGTYPTGKSSTEIFQKLIDDGYCTNPYIFYFAMPGKTRPISRLLRPENVCWDVTVPVTSSDPDELPMVFSTGYRLDYAAGGKATPINPAMKDPGLTVAYKSNLAKYVKENPDHIFPGVIDPAFNSKGKSYQQLTPDGPLSP